jgi:hypothetical protein
MSWLSLFPQIFSFTDLIILVSMFGICLPLCAFIYSYHDYDETLADVMRDGER